MILLENAFVYSLEEAAITVCLFPCVYVHGLTRTLYFQLDESVWKAVERLGNSRLGNSRPQTETQAAAGLVP
jgi:hypothetical protein